MAVSVGFFWPSSENKYPESFLNLSDGISLLIAALEVLLWWIFKKSVLHVCMYFIDNMWKSNSVIKLKNRSLVFGLRKKIKWKSGKCLLRGRRASKQEEQEEASIFGDVKGLDSCFQISLEGLILECFKGGNTESKSSNPHAAFS